MAGFKRLVEKMADEGLHSFVVSFTEGGGSEVYQEQYWAMDAEHATEQCIDAGFVLGPVDTIRSVHLVETQAEWVARNERELDYGQRDNV